MKKHVPKHRWKLLKTYQRYLREVVGLAPSTCQNHLRDLGHFLEARSIQSAPAFSQLSQVDVTNYLSVRSADYAPVSLRQVAGSLRQFLRFAQQRGWTHAALSLAVPKIAGRGQRDLPGYLNRGQLELLLASWDRTTAQGRRDWAIGLCLARLGLRAGEVAALVLEDVDWRQGILRVDKSKSATRAELPLLWEVGQGIADYLCAGRPAGEHREIFLRHPSARPMDGQAVSRVIEQALRRCGLEVQRPGAHLLRHTLASHLVQKGASLKEVADVLRHRHLNSAAVYAHVDLAQLRPLAQPWPQEATR